MCCGGLYVVVWCWFDGELLLVCEDIGCYNVLDKFVGVFVCIDVDCCDGFVLMFSCVSYEFVYKIVMVGVGLLVCLLVFSSLVIEMVVGLGL